MLTTTTKKTKMTWIVSWLLTGIGIIIIIIILGIFRFVVSSHCWPKQKVWKSLKILAHPDHHQQHYHLNSWWWSSSLIQWATKSNTTTKKRPKKSHLLSAGNQLKDEAQENYWRWIDPRVHVDLWAVHGNGYPF